MGFFEELRRRIAAKEDGFLENPPMTLDELSLERFEGSLTQIPSFRSTVYKVYGRAPKDKNPAHKGFPKAKMTMVKNLPGEWNKSRGRLYTLAFMEDYLREALSRCERLGVLGDIEKIGCYSHRHIRHNTNNPLSYHSWGAAVDINQKDNKAISKKNETIWPPFSKQCLERYPNHLPLEVVRAFQSVGFSWGGDWGRTDWYNKVKAHGVGWDAEDEATLTLNGILKYRWPDKWETMTFYDPMHFELIRR